MLQFCYFGNLEYSEKVTCLKNIKKWEQYTKLMNSRYMVIYFFTKLQDTKRHIFGIRAKN